VLIDVLILQTKNIDMKKHFILLTHFCIALLFFACNNKQGQLVGKWQKSDDPNVVIEFKNGGIYEISMKGEKLPSLKYVYSPGLNGNNLQIGEDSLKLIGNIEFVQKDKIHIKTSKPDMTIEYQRIS
jgi:hypothetical protein